MKYFLTVIAADLNLRGTVFKIDMSPSFYYGELPYCRSVIILKVVPSHHSPIKSGEPFVTIIFWKDSFYSYQIIPS